MLFCQGLLFTDIKNAMVFGVRPLFLNKENNLRLRHMREVIKIRQTPANMNRDQGPVSSKNVLVSACC